MYTSLLLVAVLGSGYYPVTIIPGPVTISPTIISAPVSYSPVMYGTPVMTSAPVYVGQQTVQVGRRGRVIRRYV